MTYIIYDVNVSFINEWMIQMIREQTVYFLILLACDKMKFCCNLNPTEPH